MLSAAADNESCQFSVKFKGENLGTFEIVE